MLINNMEMKHDQVIPSFTVLDVAYSTWVHGNLLLIVKHAKIADIAERFHKPISKAICILNDRFPYKPMSLSFCLQTCPSLALLFIDDFIQ